MNAHDVAAVVLAGGRARRLGGLDKPLLELGGVAILSRVIDTIRMDVKAIAISGNGDLARFAAFGLPVLTDGPFQGEGPLAGVLAGMDWASGIGASILLTVPGDTPFIPHGLPDTLAPPPACAVSNGQPHHLVALWPIACRNDLRRLLSSPGRRDIAHFSSYIGMRRVDFPSARWDPFLNINTPEDLAKARAIAEAQT